jgi:hypothetical protein
MAATIPQQEQINHILHICGFLDNTTLLNENENNVEMVPFGTKEVILPLFKEDMFPT